MVPQVRRTGQWQRAVAVFAGGTCGTALRSLLLAGLGHQVLTLAAINLLGAFVLGAISGYYGQRVTLLRVFLAVGGVASFTSWSSLAVQGVQSWQDVAVVLVEVTAGVAAAGAGHLLGLRGRA